jgi:hypothetical protein
MMMSIPGLVAESLARLANGAVTLLRNRQNLNLSRDEFRFCRIGFSQFGEDLAVTRWLDEKLGNVPKIYVDAGCFHPIHCSNTLLLHERGWQGVNIDMSHQKLEAFRKLRPRDFNVAAALSSRPKQNFIVTSGIGLTDRLSDSHGGNPSLREHSMTFWPKLRFASRGSAISINEADYARCGHKHELAPS